METVSYPQRLHHRTPGWVADGAVFHIRIRCARALPDLTGPEIAQTLLNSVNVYAEKRKWSCFLFLVMPDHLHGLLSFSRESGMSRIIADWKRFHAGASGLVWQEGFFDHRLRTEQEFAEKFAYIQRNPVVKGLCRTAEDWPWQVINTQALPQF